MSNLDQEFSQAIKNDLLAQYVEARKQRDAAAKVMAMASDKLKKLINDTGTVTSEKYNASYNVSKTYKLNSSHKRKSIIALDKATNGLVFDHVELKSSFIKNWIDQQGTAILGEDAIQTTETKRLLVKEV